MTPRSKGEIALAELDRLRAAGVRFGTVLADAGYGASAAFRHGLEARGCPGRWHPPQPKGLRPERAVRASCGAGSQASAERRAALGRGRAGGIAMAAGKLAPWHQGCTGRSLRRHPCAGRGWPGVEQQPAFAGRQAWLVGEWRSSGERKFYLSNLSPRASLRTLAAAIKARWVCEQAHQQLKGELGLGHFEGRSWTGLHRHALMSCIAFAYLQDLRLAGQRRTGRKKTRTLQPGPPPQPSLPALRRAIIGRLFAPLVPPVQCPHCRQQFQLPSDLKVPR